jgi:hypothetical protein
MRTGISPPEFLGEHFEAINDYLKKRDVIYDVSKS